jgi:hypothetical protein
VTGLSPEREAEIRNSIYYSADGCMGWEAYFDLLAEIDRLRKRIDYLEASMIPHPADRLEQAIREAISFDENYPRQLPEDCCGALDGVLDILRAAVDEEA